MKKEHFAWAALIYVIVGVLLGIIAIATGSTDIGGWALMFYIGALPVNGFFAVMYVVCLLEE